MNKRIAYLASVAFAAAGMLTGCSDSYLDLTPPTDFPDSDLDQESVLEFQVSGIYEAMNCQYNGYDVNQNVGEAQVCMNWGEAMGADYVSGLWNVMPGLRSWDYINNVSSYLVGVPWMYYYNIVNLSNYAIRAVPETSAEPGEASKMKLNLKAQALTMRAHAYTRLLGYYGQRWEDSKNTKDATKNNAEGLGGAYCIVMPTEPQTGNMPLVTMNEVLKLIYDDLDEAIALFGMTGEMRANNWETNLSVAQGVYARAAMLCHDWKTAADMAAAARKGYTIMSEKELYAGFFEDTTETMWSMNPTELTTYYWSWGSHYSCNGAYVNNWAIGAGAMNIDIYNTMQKEDLRRKFYWMPDKLTKDNLYNKKLTIKEKDFWNPDYVDAENMLNMNLSKPGTTAKPTMTSVLGYWLWQYHQKTFTGNTALIDNDDRQYNSYILAYNDKDKKAVRLGADASGNPIYANVLATPFGVQNKFWSIAPYGNMAFPWMRASEMALTEAEAQYMLGNEGAAKAALADVQSKRIPGYTSNKSGQALLDEIRNDRRVELWGEGFAFLDLKRWNMPRVRRVWVANDPNSGNIPPEENAGLTAADVAKKQSVKYCNGWRIAIPQREYQYNTAIDLSLLETITD